MEDAKIAVIEQLSFSIKGRVELLLVYAGVKPATETVLEGIYYKSRVVPAGAYNLCAGVWIA